ncbi:hypothetical protein L7D48_23425 [Streptomyces sp. S1A]|uniref:Uncharacterized protein n=1 Tax=Streptomyces chitinivorans TaxID=1257027 RepID=A0ABW7HTH1_9ACTN|nr:MULTISPECIES: hypothetical protein [Streptomyces]MCG3043483.1 hypothetical protein [Streptomyces sp. ICN903]MDH2410247.1 hypothetical protein [Streptomyces chitinivorans]
MKASAVLERAIPAVLAGWFVASVLSQHPDRSYDKLRSMDKTGTGILIPNWRFFAPNPAVEDQHFLYRLASEDRSEHTEWREVYSITPRKMAHAFWFPGRRMEKAVFDVASTLVHNPGAMTPLHQEAKKAAYRLVGDFVRRRIKPEPGYPLFQVMLVRYSGYDHSEDPKYDMVFDYERVTL